MDCCVFIAGEFTTKELSVWVVGDYSTEQTRQAALEALTFAVSGHSKIMKYTAVSL